MTLVNPRESLSQTDDLESSSSIILKKEDLDHFDSLNSALSSMSGVQIKDFGGAGWNPIIQLRGASQDNVLVIVDGMVINNQGSFTQNLSSLALQEIEEIRVYKNNTSLKYGKNQAGGIIEIKTLKKKKQQARVEVGSFQTYGITLFHPLNEFQSFKASYLEAQNDFLIVNENSTPLDTSDDFEEKRKSNAFYQNTFEFTHDKDNLLFKYNFLGTIKEIPNENNTITSASLQTTLHQLRYSQKMKQTKLFIGFSYKEEDYRDQNSQIGLGIQDNTYLTYNTQTQLSRNFQLSSRTLYTLGLFVEAQNFQAIDNLTFDETRFDAFNLNINNEFQHFLYKSTLKWFLSSMHYHVSGNSQISFEDLSYGLGQRFELPFILKYNLTRNIRFPYAHELFGDRGLSVANQELQPETSWHADLGLIWERKDFSLEVNYFSLEFNNLITQVFNSQGIGSFENIASARIDGYEAKFHFNFTKNLFYSAGATFQNPQDTSQTLAFRNKLLPGRFKETYTQSLIYQKKKFRVDLTYLKQNTMFYDRANTLDALDLNTLNLALTYHGIRMEVNNITNNRFELFNGYPNQGQNLRFSYQAHF
jgi:outer membrane cobalamin receptor